MSKLQLEIYYSLFIYSPVTVTVATASRLSTYPIAETFHSLQGEGYWSGCSTFFIRLGGCDVYCPWCDQKETWNLERHPKQTVVALCQQAIATNPAFVVITGGEPLMHDLSMLCEALAETGLRRHLETSGAHPLTGQFEWITLSPKPFKPPMPKVYAHASELKVVIKTVADFEWAESESVKVPPTTLKYLQPEWETPASQALIINYIQQHPEWRLSLQSHKYLGVR